MQSYNGKLFAQIYNSEFSAFAREIGPKILSFYKSKKISRVTNSVLDLGCGSGQLAQVFLDENYKVTGIDLSEDMLYFAEENNRNYVRKGDANFIKKDMSKFTLDKSYGLVVSTFDAINHLENEDALFSCFNCVYQQLVSNGFFIFDLNTKAALSSWKWRTVNIIDREDLMMVTRGIYNDQLGKAFFLWTGFLQGSDGKYERFEQVNFNTVFDTARIKELLLQAGWRKVHFANIKDLSRPIERPEEVDQENALVVIAQK